MLLRLTKPPTRSHPQGEHVWINPDCIAQMHSMYVEAHPLSGYRTVLYMTQGYGQVWVMETPEEIQKAGFREV